MEGEWEGGMTRGKRVERGEWFKVVSVSVLRLTRSGIAFGDERYIRWYR